MVMPHTLTSSSNTRPSALWPRGVVTTAYTDQKSASVHVSDHQLAHNHDEDLLVVRELCQRQIQRSAQHIVRVVLEFGTCIHQSQLAIEKLR